MKKLLFFWNELKSTFWFVPVLIMFGSITLALFLLNLDSKTEVSQEGIGKFLFIGSADSARSVLSTISGAMIGVAGTVFSVTLVALTLASNQFGSRLIKNFMYVRLNQVVLGSYISTYIYCLIVLNTIKETDNITFIPSISILIALLAAVINIILLIIFIHQIAISIQADKVISDISESIAKDVKVIYPERLGEGIDGPQEHVPSDEKSDYNKCIPILAQKSGYLQYIDSEALLKKSIGSDYLVELFFRPGDHVVFGEQICCIYSNQELDEEDQEDMLQHFIIGKSRTSQQDLEFSIHQMVEIAARALSSGVNDPYTAISCIGNLTATLSQLAVIKFPSKYRLDEDGKLRVIADVLDFEGVLDAAFNQIRQFSAGSPSVIIRLMEAIITISKFTEKPGYQKAIARHAEMILNVGKESIKEKRDFGDLEKRYDVFVMEDGRNNR